MLSHLHWKWPIIPEKFTSWRSGLGRGRFGLGGFYNLDFVVPDAEANPDPHANSAQGEQHNLQRVKMGAQVHIPSKKASSAMGLTNPSPYIS